MSALLAPAGDALVDPRPLIQLVIPANILPEPFLAGSAEAPTELAVLLGGVPSFPTDVADRLPPWMDTGRFAAAEP